MLARVVVVALLQVGAGQIPERHGLVAYHVDDDGRASVAVVAGGGTPGGQQGVLHLSFGFEGEPITCAPPAAARARLRDCRPANPPPGARGWGIILPADEALTVSGSGDHRSRRLAHVPVSTGSAVVPPAWWQDVSSVQLGRRVDGVVVPDGHCRFEVLSDYDDATGVTRHIVSRTLRCHLPSSPLADRVSDLTAAVGPFVRLEAMFLRADGDRAWAVFSGRDGDFVFAELTSRGAQALSSGPLPVR